MIDTLLGLSILFPIVTGLICLGVKNHKARGGIVYLTTIVLIVSSILLLRQGSFPLEYSCPSLGLVNIGLGNSIHGVMITGISP